MSHSIRVLICSIASLVIGSASLAAEPRRNVVLIVVDDPGYADLGTSSHRPADITTPQLDKLAAQSTRFAQAYVTAPICNASRIAILTGRYQQRLGQLWYGGPGLTHQKSPTIAEMLKANGYRTAMIGKVHHGSNDRVGNRNHPLKHGYDVFFGFLASTKHYLKHAGEFERNGAGMLYMGPMMEGETPVDRQGLTTEMFGERARQFVEESRSKPFFLHLSFNAVHNYTHQLPAEYLASNGLPQFPDFDPAKEGYWDWRKKLGYPAHPSGRGYYLGQLHFLDREIGRLLAHLAELGVDDHTAVILLGDNGGSLVTYAVNAPLNGGKYTLFEGGIRVPLMVRDPRYFSAGEVSDRVVSALDLLPTIAALTGSEPPAGADGEDLTQPAPVPRTLYWNTGHELAIRRGNWKLLETKKAPNPRLQIAPTPKGLFLFDLAADPGESQDVAAEHPAIVARLSAQLEAWSQRIRTNP